MSNSHTLTGAMQDGRFFTDYSPICKLNAKLATESNIQSWNSTEYRNYLQKNGLSYIHHTMNSNPCGTMDCADNGIAILPPQNDVTPPYTEDSEL
jgi:hypothetical protein